VKTGFLTRYRRQLSPSRTVMLPALMAAIDGQIYRELGADALSAA